MNLRFAIYDLRTAFQIGKARVNRKSYIVNLLVLALAASNALAASVPTSPPAVTVTQDRSAYTLSNGVVTAKVHKASGDLLSLKFKGLELLAAGSGHPFGYWSHAPARGGRSTNWLTIDPAKNGGERA